MDLLAMAKEQFPYTVGLRRHFHEYPESGPEEQVQTMAYVIEELKKLDIPYEQVPGGGIFAFIPGSPEGKTVLMRADMDALPIQESETNLAGPKACVSKIPGVMHGCGHDGHLAMLLTEARILKSMQKDLKGSILLMFEEGEEGHGNGQNLCLYLQKHKLHADICYASHVRWDVPVGKVSCNWGTAMSGLYHFELELFGQAGHGSRPDLAHSTLDCFHEIYNALQTLRLRYVRPNASLTWSIGSIHAGERFNVVPDDLVCQGSVRFLDKDSGMAFWAEFRRVLDSVCPLNYCSYRLRVPEFLLPTINTPACTKLFRDAAKEYLGPDSVYECEPWMASETFSFICNMIPGVNSFTGIRDDRYGSGANHHTPEFDIAEEGLIYGVAAALGYVLNYLESPPDLSDFQPVCENMEDLIAMLRNA